MHSFIHLTKWTKITFVWLRAFNASFHQSAFIIQQCFYVSRKMKLTDACILQSMHKVIMTVICCFHFEFCVGIPYLYCINKLGILKSHLSTTNSFLISCAYCWWPCSSHLGLWFTV